jgi:hypothetical protein
LRKPSTRKSSSSLSNKKRQTLTLDSDQIVAVMSHRLVTMRIVFVTEQEQEQVKLIESLSLFLAKLSLFLTASRISTKPHNYKLNNTTGTIIYCNPREKN